MGIYFTSDFEGIAQAPTVEPARAVTGVVRFLRHPFEAARRFRERSQQRAELAALGEHLLSDIGVRRADVEYGLLDR
jgi:uncharacterized protein YjiS (DUF1127 family)